jgi:NADPH-dependent curcumin reductase CurA
VGQVVGQLAKLEGIPPLLRLLILGLQVVGSAGDDKKVQYLEELGFAAFNHKKERISQALKRLCPKGIDIYWDNVGGKTLDAALVNMRNFGRIVACGMISVVAEEQPYGVKYLRMMISKRLLFQGFIQTDLREEYYADFLRDMTKYYKEGDIKYKEDVTDGLENAIQGLIGMLNGRNFGKAVIKV